MKLLPSTDVSLPHGLPGLLANFASSPFFFTEVTFYGSIAIYMAFKVLITAPYFQPMVGKFQDIFEKNKIELILPQVNERLTEDELLMLVSDIHGIICGDDRITERVLDNAPNLKVIVKWGTGIDSIDREAAAKRDIPVKNTPNAFTEPVADTILSFILAFARGTIDLDRKMRAGIWEKKLNLALNECTLGVVGVGNIGKAVIKRAQAFGMKIIANDIKETSLDFMVSLENLLRESDFIALCCDLNQMGYHLINKSMLTMMKPTAYLINTARGPLIDEVALIEALEQGRIAGAALDVFENEPLADNHPFKKMQNVILSPHNANSSLVAWEKVHINSINSLIEELLKL